VRAEINRLHQAIGTTIIYVTHDQVEAMTLADRIVIMRGGVIEQVGTPDEVYNHPASVFVGGFIGAPAMNFLKARVESGSVRLADGGAIALNGLAGGGCLEGRELLVGMRPEHFAPGYSGAGQLSGRVQVVEPLGADTLVHFQVGEHTVTARMPPETRPTPGEKIAVSIDPQRLFLFDPTTERAMN